MIGHTPGPWEVLPIENGVDYLRVRGTVLGGRYKVCNVHAGLQHFPGELLQSQSNARLIAAAPDLLEALQKFRHSDALTHGEQEMIAALIRKATGAAE